MQTNMDSNLQVQRILILETSSSIETSSTIEIKAQDSWAFALRSTFSATTASTKDVNWLSF